MERRDFFKHILKRPLESLTERLAENLQESEEPSEQELFLEAMGFGIDPATLSPTELRRTVMQKRQEASARTQP